MINHEYAENFTFKNVIYIVTGSSVFMGPWMMMPVFWAVLDKMEAGTILMANMLALIIGFSFLTYLLLEKHSMKRSSFLAFRRLVFIYVTVAVTSILILSVYGKVVFTDPASIFSRKVLSSLFACFLAGNMLDMIMNK